MKLKQFLKGELKSIGDSIFSGIASSGREDRDGDTINSNGWILDNYLKNPIMLWGHNPHNPPVGKTFNLRVEGGQLRFDFQMANTPMGQELKTLIQDGFLNTFSVGFMPQEFGNQDMGQPTFTKQELLEISLVSIPSNVDAMITSRAFKSCSEETKHFVLGEIKRAKTIVEHGSGAFPEAKGYAWDEEAERRASDLEDLKSMATFVDDQAPHDKESYKLLHHSRNKDYPLVREAIEKALTQVDSLPEEARIGATEHLQEHLKQLTEEPTKAVEEAKDDKPNPSASEGTKSATVELADEDRQLLKRVAAVLEKATEEPVQAMPEANNKVDRSRSDEDRATYRREVMIRALQLTAKTVSKRLCQLKKSP